MMYKNQFLLSLILFISANTFGQIEQYNPDKLYTKTQLKADLDILANELQLVHPSIFRYISKEEFLAEVQQTKTRLDTELTETAFQNELRKLIKSIGCGHTAAKPSAEWYDYYRNNYKALPLKVYIHDDEIYVRYSVEADSVLKNGTKLHAINGVLSIDIVSELRAIQQIDGTTNSYESAQIEKLFGIYFVFLQGIRDEHTVDFINKDEEIQSITIPSGNPNLNLFQLESEDLISKMEGSTFYYLDDVNSTAVIDIDNFPSGKYKKFYKEVFNKIESDQIQNLVIDLRGNGGGYFPNSIYFLRYLLQDKFSMEFTKSKNKIKNKQYYNQNMFEKMTVALFKIIPDRNKEDQRRNHKINYKPFKKNNYKNNLFVLTDGSTFSMASYVATKLKHFANCTLIGSETGGTEVGSNALIWQNLILPNTNVQVAIPKYFIDHTVQAREEGKGLMPDHTIEYQLEEILKKVDKEMEVVRTLIKEK